MAALNRDRAEVRALEKLLGGDLPSRDSLHGKSCFVDSVLRAGLGLQLDRWGLVVAEEAHHAEVFVCSNPGQLCPSLKRSWAIMLVGGLVLSPAVLRGENGGISLKYKAALSTTLPWHMSDDFEAKHGDKAATIRACIGLRRCRLQLLDCAQYTRRKDDRTKKPWALITSADKKHRAINFNIERAFTGADFLANILVVNHKQSYFGQHIDI